MSEKPTDTSPVDSSDTRKRDRRSGRDRRRNNEQPHVAIEIGESQLHAAIVYSRDNGESICRVDSRPWRKESESLNASGGIDEFRAALEGLVTDYRLAGAPLRLSLGGQLCITRSITGSSNDLQRELQDGHERAKSYLALGPGRKCCASSIESLDARHNHALLTVTCQQTLDDVATVIESCGLVLTAVEASQVSLCRLMSYSDAATAKTCLLVQVSGDQPHVTAMRGGRLLLDYRPGNQIGGEGWADLVGRHFHRILRYCQRQFEGNDGNIERIVCIGDKHQRHIEISGDGKPRCMQVEQLNLADFRLPCRWEGESPSDELAAVVGAVLASVGGEESTPYPDLAEGIDSLSKPPIMPVLIRMLAPLAACLLLGLTMRVVNWQLEGGNEAREAELNQLAPIVARSERLQKTLRAQLEEMNELKQLVGSVENPSWSGLIASIGACMPEDVWLDAFTVQDFSDVTLSGAGYAESGVYDFVGYLQHMPTTDEAALLGTATKKNRGFTTTSFDINLTLQSQHAESQEN